MNIQSYFKQRKFKKNSVIFIHFIKKNIIIELLFFYISNKLLFR